MTLKLPTSHAVHHKTVLVRVDFNVPLDKTVNPPKIKDASRIEVALKTIRFLIENEAKVILMSHLGRPKVEKTDEAGKSISDPELSMETVAAYLGKEYKLPVSFVPACTGPEVRAAVGALEFGQVLVLENLRFYAGEKKNDPAFSQGLASLAEVYIDEAFSNVHRAHASMVGVPGFLPSLAGFRLAEEVTNLHQLIHKPKRPFVIVVGGAKISDKVGALTNLSKIADAVLVGGGVANNFLKADGIETHKSYLQDAPADLAKEKINYVQVADDIIESHRTERLLKDGYIPLPKIIYPTDAIAAASLTAEKTQVIDLTHDVADTDHDKKLMYLDIGPNTIRLYKELILQAGTIFWNGPMGVYEQDRFGTGTAEIAKAISRSSAMTVLGGGDTIGAIHKFGLSDRYDYVSAAGSAALEYLSGNELPGLTALGIRS